MIESNNHKMNTDRAWDKLYTRLEENQLLVEPVSRKRRMMPLLSYGAAVAAVIACLVYGIALLMPTSDGKQEADLITQENSDKSSLVTTLEDGSIIYLAQQSSLKYPTHFESNARSVKLQGDAYFDIMKNQERPFMIETESVRIKVLGTAFDVRSGKESDFSLSVQRGCVKVTSKKSGEEVYVKAGEMATFQGEQLNVKQRPDAGQYENYWKNIRFKDEPLENILRVINLHSPELKLKALHALGERKLTVEFSEHSAEVVAQLICLALNVKSTRQGNMLILSE